MFHLTLLLWLHLLAVVIWLGGMAFLAFVLGPYARRLRDEQRADLFQQVGQRFSRISWILIGILLITGPTNLFLRIPPSEALSLTFLSTGYGRAIMVKTSLFVIIIALSAVHDFWIGPKAHRLLASAPERPEEQRRELLEAARGWRRMASYIGRVNFVLALAVLYFAASLSS